MDVEAVDNPGVIAPPPLLFAVALGLGLLIDFLLFRVSTGIAATLRYALAVVLVIAAVGLAAGALRGFRRARTHAEPWKPTTAIVTSGVYALSRNPMYLAMTLLYCAIAIAADSVVAVVFLVPLLIVLRLGVVAREEKYLESKFEDEYRRYKAAVRRWF